jgi:hypothetical protein
VSGEPRDSAQGTARGLHRDSLASLAARVTCGNACSPGWTRTSNPLINSQMLCQLSYRGLPARADAGAERGMTLAYGVSSTPSPAVPQEAPGRVRQDGENASMEGPL